MLACRGKKRSPQLTDEEKLNIATFVGIGAVRYALVDVDPTQASCFHLGSCA